MGEGGGCQDQSNKERGVLSVGCARGLEGGESLDGRMKMGLLILLVFGEEKQRMLNDPSYDRLGVSLLASLT